MGEGQAGSQERGAKFRGESGLVLSAWLLLGLQGRCLEACELPEVCLLLLPRAGEAPLGVGEGSLRKVRG